MVVSIPALILCVIQLVQDLKKRNAQGVGSKNDFIDLARDETIPPRVVLLRGMRYLGWMVGLVVLAYIVGFKIAVFVYFILFLKLEARARWLTTLILTAIAGYLIFVHLEKLLSIYWPPYLLEPWLRPLPFL